jgi:hypothetical protein
MKKTVCPKCGDPEAANFTFTILCPKKGCVYFDAKLAEEREQEEMDGLLDGLKWLDDDLELSDLDFVAGPDFVLDLSDLDFLN